MTFSTGTKLGLRCWHQDNWEKAQQRFASDDSAVGEVVEVGFRKGSTTHFDWMKIRLWAKDDNGGCRRELFRITEKVWLEFIGIRDAVPSHLPHVIEVGDVLSDDEFERRKELVGK